jgi:hypothetical protein
VELVKIYVPFGTDVFQKGFCSFGLDFYVLGRQSVVLQLLAMRRIGYSWLLPFPLHHNHHVPEGLGVFPVP